MKEIRKFRELHDWEEAKKSLASEGFDDEVIARIDEQEGDSLDLVEICMSMEEAFGSRLRKRRES